MQIPTIISMISSIITILAFIFSVVIFLRQRRNLIYQNKTQELRNEMYAIFNLIGHFGNKEKGGMTAGQNGTEFITDWSEGNIKLFLNILNTLEKHKNQSLLLECKLNRVSFSFIDKFKNKNEYQVYINILQ